MAKPGRKRRFSNEQIALLLEAHVRIEKARADFKDLCAGMGVSTASALQHIRRYGETEEVAAARAIEQPPV